MHAAPHAPQLVDTGKVSRDTITLAEHFAEGVMNGQIVGAAICFFYRGRKYSIEVCGAAMSDPTWALGVTELMKDELKDLIHRQGAAATTI